MPFVSPAQTTGPSERSERTVRSPTANTSRCRRGAAAPLVFAVLQPEAAKTRRRAARLFLDATPERRRRAFARDVAGDTGDLEGLLAGEQRGGEVRVVAGMEEVEDGGSIFEIEVDPVVVDRMVRRAGTALLDERALDEGDDGIDLGSGEDAFERLHRRARLSLADGLRHRRARQALHLPRVGEVARGRLERERRQRA